ncbi:MAG: YraN family protein [Clostridia bacterium]|nr:YraN family protein [Clostridia bacterium]
MYATTRGIAGEVLAARFLRDKGYTILSSNYHSRFGEIDIIAVDGPYIVFVEVKARSESSFISPREAVTKSKQDKILRTASLYMRAYPSNLQPRFDVVEVWVADRDPMIPLQIDHLISAYEAGDLHAAF